MRESYPRNSRFAHLLGIVRSSSLIFNDFVIF
jgi:hypothetical protein